MTTTPGDLAEPRTLRLVFGLRRPSEYAESDIGGRMFKAAADRPIFTYDVPTGDDAVTSLHEANFDDIPTVTLIDLTCQWNPSNRDQRPLVVLFITRVSSQASLR
jgi:hypothetical protein